MGKVTRQTTIFFKAKGEPKRIESRSFCLPAPRLIARPHRLTRVRACIIDHYARAKKRVELYISLSSSAQNTRLSTRVYFWARQLSIDDSTILLLAVHVSRQLWLHRLAQLSTVQSGRPITAGLEKDPHETRGDTESKTDFDWLHCAIHSGTVQCNQSVSKPTNIAYFTFIEYFEIST